MKPKIKSKTKPENISYYPEAKIECACGQVFITGSTQPQMKVEICSNCHPFYTGNEKLIDTAGQVDKFKARMKKTQTMATKTRTKTRKAKK